eukprot:3528536-Rhodomonas_salina.2
MLGSNPLLILCASYAVSTTDIGTTYQAQDPDRRPQSFSDVIQVGSFLRNGISLGVLDDALVRDLSFACWR